ncbi:hypothetical protein D3C76_478210 [compost metagenome]
MLWACAFEELKVIAVADQQVDLMGSVVGVDLGEHVLAQPVALQTQLLGHRARDLKAFGQTAELVGGQVEGDGGRDVFKALWQFRQRALGEEHRVQPGQLPQVGGAQQRIAAQVQHGQECKVFQGVLGGVVPGDTVAVQIKPCQPFGPGQSGQAAEAAAAQQHAPEVWKTFVKLRG